MQTLIENTRKVGDSAYWGERGNWFIVACVHRDSDCIARSNFEVFQRELGKDGVAIQRFNHWGVGWIDYLIVDPSNEGLVALAESLRSALEDYPVLDEMHYSELESNEANEVWKSCYRVKDRIDYIRKHRSQFEFRSLSDMLGCVRGNYFAGYASELIN